MPPAAPSAGVAPADGPLSLADGHAVVGATQAVTSEREPV